MANCIEELKAELTQCAICLGDLQDPRCLPCLHSFCERCLRSSLHVFQQSLSPGNKSFQCPSCREKTKIPKDGIYGFPKDFKAYKISDFLKKSKQCYDIPTCGFCKKKLKEIKVFCCNCRRHYCQTCEKSVHTLPIFEDHVTLQASLLRTSDVIECNIHASEGVSHVCRTCNVEVCVVCLYNGHSDHDLVEMQNELTTRKHNSKHQFYQLQNIILDLQKHVHKLSSIGTHSEKNYANCRDLIKTQSTRLQSIIIENERKLLCEADKIFNKTSRKLLDDQYQQGTLLINAKALLLKAYDILLHGNTQNTYEELQGMEMEIETMNKLYHNLNENTVNYMGTNIEFKPVDNISIGNLSGHPASEFSDINSKMAELDDIGYFENGQDRTFEILPDIIEDDDLSAMPHNFSRSMPFSDSSDKLVEHLNRAWSADTLFEMRELCPGNPSTSNRGQSNRGDIVSNETKKDQTKHKIARNESKACQRTLENSSTNNITYCIDNNKIRHKIHIPRKLDKQNIDTSISNPCLPHQYIKLHNSKVQAKVKTVLDKKGKGEGQLNKPFSVCFNKAGNIVVGELGNRRLQVFDTKGNFKQTIGQGYVSPQCVVAIDTHRYAIVDEVTKNIKLLSTDGDIQIVPNKVSFPYALCLSAIDTFVVTDAVFDSISKITMDGNKVSQYSYHGNSLNDLDNPSAVHITENLTVFVTDTGNHQIKFLDKQLNLMYKFGCYGNSEGQLRYPRGITGNKNILFIHVADSGNNRIAMFSHSGKYIGILLDHECGIVNPAGLCYNEDKDILCVALPECNEVRIYDVKLV